MKLLFGALVAFIATTAAATYVAEGLKAAFRLPTLCESAPRLADCQEQP